MIESVAPSPDGQGEDIEGRLQAIGGLSVEVLHRAARAGLAARAGRTSLAPRNAPGTDLYSHTTEELRHVLEPHGWKPKSVGGQERTESKGGQFAIIVATGEGAVGQADGKTKNAHPKGPLMRGAIEANREFIQDGLFPLESVKMIDTERTSRTQMVYLLLLKVEDGALRMELSLPDEIDDAGHVRSWFDRITLPSLPMDSVLNIDHSPGGSGEIDIPIERA